MQMRTLWKRFLVKLNLLTMRMRRMRMSKESKSIGRGCLGIEGKRKGRVEEEQQKWEDTFFVMRRS